MNDKMIERIDRVRDFQAKLGLEHVKEFPEDDLVQHYLHMGVDDIRHLSMSECVDANYLVNSYSNFLQRQYNEEKIRHGWAKNRIAEAVSTIYTEYSSTFAPHEVKLAMIGNDNSVVKNLRDIIEWSEQRMIALDGLSRSVYNVSRAIELIHRAKVAESR